MSTERLHLPGTRRPDDDNAVPPGAAPAAPYRPPWTAGPSGPGPRHRIAVIDGLRIFAALLVMGYHYVAFDNGVRRAWGTGPALAFPEIYQAASYGWLGVELFFVISGFVICMSAWGRSTGEFVKSRAIRLFPAYWAAALITYTVVSIWPIVRRPGSVSDALLNLTMLNAPLGVRGVDGVYWTLWAEARFYLLFSLIIWRGLTFRSATVFCYVWLVASIIAVPADLPLLTTLVQPHYAAYFIAGIGFYLIHRFGSHLVLWGLVAASFLVAQNYGLDRTQHVARNILERPLPNWPAFLFHVLIFTVMAAVALGWLSRIRWRWLSAAGALTYPLYLLHEYIGWTLIKALHPGLPRYATLALVSVIVIAGAYLLHRLVERPAARVMSRLLDRPLPPEDADQPLPPDDPGARPAAAFSLRQADGRRGAAARGAGAGGTGAGGTGAGGTGEAGERSRDHQLRTAGRRSHLEASPHRGRRWSTRRV